MNLKWKRRAKYLFLVGLAVAAVLGVALAVFVATGHDEIMAHRLVVHEIERMTGARVELRAFRFSLWGLRAELDDLTLHGHESAGSPPFVHVDRVRLSIRVVSFFSRKIALQRLDIERPAVFIRIAADGTSNVPAPPSQRSPTPLRERLFDLAIQRLRIENGALQYNDTRTPLAADGAGFQFALDRNALAPGRESYTGALSWQQVNLAARRYAPFRSDLSAKFTLTRDAFSLDEFHCKLPHSELDGGAELSSFREPSWKFHYRGRAGLEDLIRIFRNPGIPKGLVDFYGDGRYAAGTWFSSGQYAAHQITLPYMWFHAGGIESSGRYEVTDKGLMLPKFEARAFGGALEGKMDWEFNGQQFRVESRYRGANLEAVLAAVDNRDFPVHTFHWDGAMDVDAVTTWVAAFHHVRSRGETRWTPDAQPPPGEIPAGARIDYDYSMDRRAVTITHSEISTRNTHIQMDGVLGAEDSDLSVQLEAANLLDWDPFINVLRGADTEPKSISGRATWRGRILGPLVGPTFTGHVHSFDARYDRLSWDEIEGDLEYSPDSFRLTNARVKHGQTTAALDLQLGFDGDWSFLPSSSWSLKTKLDRAPTDDLQGLFETNYPAHGILTGEFRGSGTRADPLLDGNFSLSSLDAWGFRVDSARGELHLRNGEIAIRNAELRRNGGRAAGDFVYRTSAQEVEFALTGAGIEIGRIEQFQTSSLPLAGQIAFDLRGKGPLLAPAGQGSIHLVNFHVGSQPQGDFEARLVSDGQRLRVELHSQMAAGKLEGQLQLGLAGEYPLSGELRLDHIDIDPFLQAGLHLHALSGPGSVDGQLTLRGPLGHPESLEVIAELSRVSLTYESVQLENDGPLRLSYRRDEVRIEQARLHGPDTDLHFAGYARFTGDRALSLQLGGAVNLRLLSGLFPSLEARGGAQAEVSVEGTYAKPRITGNAKITDAAANYGNLPTGLSHVNAEIVFDRNRLIFDHASAEVGGGNLDVSGSVTYGEGLLRYDLSATTARARVRYPEGMSWLVAGTLRLSGTTDAGALSGRVTVDRLLMGPNVDLATLIIASREPPRGPVTSSPFLRNMQLDLEVESGADARLEWTGANVQTEGSLRVRGTWEHPILLGHVHLLSGEMSFRGTRYTLSRGEINFANPFRLDPVLNVEATTTIQQYEVTLNFTGPASHLALAYRSDPPLPSSDIVALLALGSTGQESALRSSGTGGQTQGYGATAVLSEAISSQLGGRIEQLFGISRFSIDPFLAGTSTEQNAAARVTIEQQVTHGLTITYSTNATSNQQQVIQIEYAVRKDISIVALRDINGTFGLDVKFKKRFR